MSNHTPGPWSYEVEKVSGPHLTQTNLFAHGDVIGRIYCDSERDNSQANARLIAAAPELLAQLKNVTAYANNLRVQCNYEQPSCISAACAAIAKAEGRT